MHVLFVFSLTRTDLRTDLRTDRDCSRGPSGPNNCLGSSLSLMWNYLVKYRYLWGPGLQIVEHLHKAEFVPSRALIGQLGPRDPSPRCDWSSCRLTSPPLGRIPGKWVRIKSVGGWWTLGPPAPAPGGRVMADMQEMFDDVKKSLSWASLA